MKGTHETTNKEPNTVVGWSDDYTQKAQGPRGTVPPRGMAACIGGVPIPGPKAHTINFQKR